MMQVRSQVKTVVERGEAKNKWRMECGGRSTKGGCRIGKEKRLREKRAVESCRCSFESSVLIFASF